MTRTVVRYALSLPLLPRSEKAREEYHTSLSVHYILVKVDYEFRERHAELPDLDNVQASLALADSRLRQPGPRIVEGDFLGGLPWTKMRAVGVRLAHRRMAFYRVRPPW